MGYSAKLVHDLREQLAQLHGNAIVLAEQLFQSNRPVSWLFSKAGPDGFSLNGYEVAADNLSRSRMVFRVFLDDAVAFSPGDLLENVFALVLRAESFVYFNFPFSYC